MQFLSYYELITVRKYQSQYSGMHLEMKCEISTKTTRNENK